MLIGKISRPKVKRLSPFLDRLVREPKWMFIHFFIHSVYTTVGQKIYANMGAILVGEDAKPVTEYKQHKKRPIYEGQQLAARRIAEQLYSGEVTPDTSREIHVMLSSKTGKVLTNPREDEANIDLLFNRPPYTIAIEIKTALPNKRQWADFKEHLLLWIAEFDTLQLRPIFALPYNPFHPKPYQWGMGEWVFDRASNPPQMLIGDEFWDYLGGHGSYEDILEIFDDVGKVSYDKVKSYLN